MIQFRTNDGAVIQPPPLAAKGVSVKKGGGSVKPEAKAETAES